MGKNKKVNRKKIWISISVAVLAILLLITIIVALNKDESKTSVEGGQTIYKVKVTSIKVNDMSDWEIKGTTSAPDGAKLFATYGDETSGEEFGINAASSTTLTSWATVRNGKFTMIVNPLTMHYEKEYEGGKNISAYLFAVKGLSGNLSNYNIKSKISDTLKSAIAKNVRKTNLILSDSQAKYYNNLGKTEESSSSEDSSETNSISSSESSRAESGSSVSDYQTGITYDQIARNPNDYKDKQMQFTGKVIQVIEDDGAVQIRLAVEGNSDNIILVNIDNSLLNGSRVLEDDLVTASGISKGTVSYKSTLGEKITVPSMEAKIINDQGKASDDYGE
ncbi:hypothetical protein [Leuconostoc citreum]|uniref:hypothetical protein n=1 Tax=Leuconostoc citreum TaxID=33964 RepID=UPI001F1089A3|nr:hypothetical protein [Leuconostoc citreum]